MNRNRNTFIIFSLICISVISLKCQKNKIVFPRKFDLQAEIITIPSVNNPRYIRIIDSCLIIVESAAVPNFIKVFRKDSFIYLSSAGRLGKGPGEIVNPAIICVDRENRRVWCPDWGKNKIWLFPLDSILQNSNYLPTFSVPIPLKSKPLRNLTIYNQDIFAFPSFSIFISFLNHSGEVIDSMGIKNPFEIDFWDKTSLADLPYIFTFKHDRTKVFIASLSKNFIGGIDFNGEKQFTINGPQIKNKVILSNWDKIGTYAQLVSDEQYVYCLYSGKVRGIFLKEQLKYDPQYPDKIHVFDWDGNPVALIQLEYPLFFFDLDNEENKIFGIDPKMRPSIICYELPDFE